jgi:CoA:oxalate CoA-transferase
LKNVNPISAANNVPFGLPVTESRDAESLPLNGFTVLDFTRVLAGPYCTRMLADLGAQVIKIERPGEGDEIRFAPYQLDPERVDQSTYYVRVNAGKLSVAIDLAHADAKEIIFDLLRKSDVVVENFAPGVMQRLGFDYAKLSAIKPDIVYCSISGFGQTGPLSSLQAYAHLINAISGLMELDRGVDPVPRVAYLQAADGLAGTHAFGAINAALIRKLRTGKGAYIDVSMLECLIAAEDVTFGSILNGGPIEQGPRYGMIVHAVGDGYVAMQAVGAPHLWLRIIELLEKPELKTDERFSTAVLRRKNWATLSGFIRTRLERFSSVNEAIAALSSARIPAVPVLTPHEVIAHPQLIERGAFPSVDYRDGKRVRVTATPFHLDGKPTVPRGLAAFRVGEHTQQVLSKILTYTPEQIAALIKQGVVASS